MSVKITTAKGLINYLELAIESVENIAELDDTVKREAFIDDLAEMIESVEEAIEHWRDEENPPSPIVV